MEINIWR